MRIRGADDVGIVVRGVRGEDDLPRSGGVNGLNLFRVAGTQV
jgi:hypothetical protein